MQTQTSNTLYNAIIEAGGKDRPPMLALGNYVQWKSRIQRYIDTKTNHEHIYYCLKNPPYKFTWADKEVPISEGSAIKCPVEYLDDHNAPIRVSTRIYVGIGALKEGLKASGRELLGLDRDLISGTFFGQVLTTVGIDANSGIYHVAYRIIEAECKDSWFWFLNM
nr:hypothetical protein [Tanacetum cinerariifolium]